MNQQKESLRRLMQGLEGRQRNGHHHGQRDASGEELMDQILTSAGMTAKDLELSISCSLEEDVCPCKIL